MDAQQVKTYIDVMAASDLDELEISHDGWTLRLVRHSGGVRVAREPGNRAAGAPPLQRDPAAPAAQGTSDDGGPHEVRAPMFGVVHLQSAPGQAPFVSPGDVVEAGALLCTIEAMKVFNEVRAERGGRIASVLVSSGAEVEAGQVLMIIERGRDV